MDEETLEILIDAQVRGARSVDNLADQVDQLGHQVEELMSVMAESVAATEAATVALEEHAVAAELDAAAIDHRNEEARRGIPILSGFSTAIGGGTNAASGFLLYGNLLIGVIVLLTAVLLPVLPVIVGATAAVVAFGAGIAAVLTLVTVAAAGIIGLAAAFALLVKHVADKGLVVSPFKQLSAAIEQTVDVWGKRAAPMVASMIRWLVALNPQIRSAGNELITWFGARLPAVLHIADSAFAGSMEIVRRFGTVWGRIIDQSIARAPQFGKITKNALDFVADAINGLSDNLFRLSSWFIQRLPALSPIMNDIFKGMGETVQTLGKRLGELVDWTIAHWPELTQMWKDFWGTVGPILGQFVGWIERLTNFVVEKWPEFKKNVDQVFSSFQAGWRATKPSEQEWIGFNILLGKTFGDVGKNQDNMRTAATLLGGSLGILAQLALALFSAILFVASAIQAAVGWFQRIGDLAGWVGNQFWNLANAIDASRRGYAGLPAGFKSGQGAGGGGGALLSFDAGGTVPGPLGAPMLAIIHGGERVLRPGESARAGGGGNGPMVVNNYISGAGLNEAAVAAIVDRKLARVLGR